VRPREDLGRLMRPLQRTGHDTLDLNVCQPAGELSRVRAPARGQFGVDALAQVLLGLGAIGVAVARQKECEHLRSILEANRIRLSFGVG